MNVSEQKKLFSELKILNKRLEKRNSIKHTFYHGVVHGIGYSLGAGIAAGLILIFLINIASSIDYIPIINQFLNSTEIRESLKSLQNP